MMKPRDQALEVWGDFACFTRPEMKVERFSYPVMTPSAARGIYDAIYCKPKEFRWQITQIEILSPPEYIALRRNEMKDKVSERALLSWMRGDSEPEPILADANKDQTGSDAKGRTQRQTMALKNVRYRLHAFIMPWPDFQDRIEGLENQFRRRASQGKCIYQPYFGCREFPAYFELLEILSPPAGISSLNMNLGFMLYDVFDLSRPGSNNDTPYISLFEAKIENGVLNVPEFQSHLVLKP